MNTRLMILAVFALSSFTYAAEPAAPAGGMTIDKEKKTITIDAKIAPRKLDYLNEIYPIEVIACWPHPKGKKAHETVVTFDVKPSDVHKALESFGLKPGKQATETEIASGPELKISLELPAVGGGTKTIPIEQSLVDKKTNMPMPKLKWHFTGAPTKKPNPDKDEQIYGADIGGTLICVFPVTDEVVIQSHLKFADQKLLRMETNKKALPPEGTPVKIVIQAL